MQRFVNRDEELARIDEAMATLMENKRLLQTPILEFYGVNGIGKSTLLREVVKMCSNKSLYYLWNDLSHNLDFLSSTKDLSQKEGPIVVIFNSLDAASPDLLREFESVLDELIERSNLFFVLASRDMKKFENKRSIARKLTPHLLKPLSFERCKDYLNNFSDSITPEIRDMIFEWTRGYPLAMNVMADAIVDKHLNPRREADQKVLISILTEKVINQTLLASVLPNEHKQYQKLLSLLSIPRRFNLIILQDIIERFAPQLIDKYKLESGLTYIMLPRQVNQATGLLSWDMGRAGYSIDAPIRNLFLLKLRIEEPDEYVKIYKFLAEENERFVPEVSGTDRIRYMREFFYHLAMGGKVANLQAILTQHIERLFEGEQRQSHENWTQFYEEFSQDEELKEVLRKVNTDFVLTLIRSKLTNL